jgi:hypothetical protein
MSKPADWAFAYARQAAADFHAWGLAERHPRGVAAGCHQLQLLQMACEKLCKARRILGGSPPADLQRSHGYIEGPLPEIMKREIIHSGQDPKRMQGVLKLVRHLAGEIEILNPSMDRGGRRPDNCEYPWEAGDQVVSPLDWTFAPLRLITVPAGRTFLKLLCGAIDRVLDESRH